MLSRADAALAAREPGIPGIATVLDPEILAERLQERLPGLDIRSIQQSYVHYKPATNCLVACRLRTGTTDQLCYAKAYGPDAGVKLHKTAILSAIPTPPGPGTLIFEDIATAIYLFPVDHRLKALKRMANREQLHNLVKHLYPKRPGLHDGQLTTLTYKPERRYVARLDVEEQPRAVVKFYNHAGYRAARAAAGAFENSDPPQLSLPAACSDRYQALAFDWLQGAALDELLRNPTIAGQEKSTALQQTGAALARLQDQPRTGLMNRDHDSECSRLLAQAETIRHLAPDLYPRAQRLAQKLVEQLATGTRAVRALHGDFYDRQVLVGDDGRVILLDLDNAALGETAADPGLFIAHLERAVLRGEIDAEQQADFSAAFLQGYTQDACSADETRIRLYTAIGLFYLAAEPFRYREPDWAERIDVLLARCESLGNLAGNGPASSTATAQGIRSSCL